MRFAGGNAKTLGLLLCWLLLVFVAYEIGEMFHSILTPGEWD